MMIADCPGCMSGKHEDHVTQWGSRPEGIIDGEFCYCKGDCAERAQAAFDEFFGNMAGIMGEDELALSPDAQRLIDGLKSTDPARRNEAVREVNRLLAEDPLDDGARDIPPVGGRTSEATDV